MRWRITIAEAERIPDRYGISHYLCGKPCRAACYPIPFNVVIGGARALWWVLRHRRKPVLSGFARWPMLPSWRMVEWAAWRGFVKR